MFGLKIKLFLLGVFAVFIAVSQDIHLSQFQASPLLLNPGLGGQYSGDWQAGNSFREQWRSIEAPYRTNVFFAERRFFYFSKEVNIGFIASHDRAGYSNLTNNTIQLSIAYPFTQGRSTISVGIQPGFVLRSYRNDLTFPNQFDRSSGYFNNELESGEGSIYGNTNRAYFIMNTGVFWSIRLPNFIPSVGISLFNLNQPDESFNRLDDQAGIKFNVHADAYVQMKNKVYLRPAILYSGKRKAGETLIGSELGKKIRSDGPISLLFTGLYYRDGIQRNGDAIIPTVGFTYNFWKIGLSYDLTVSDYSEANTSQGGFELSVIYRVPSSVPKHSAIPCERY